MFGNPALPPSYHFEEGIAGLFSCNTDYTFKYTPPPSSVHPFTISLAVENQMGEGQIDNTLTNPPPPIPTTNII